MEFTGEDVFTVTWREVEGDEKDMRCKDRWNK
jgi:hypothetical protein